MKPVFRLLPLILLIAAVCLMHCLIGGTRHVFSLPSFALLGIAGLLTLRLPRPNVPGRSSRCLLATALVFSYLLVRAALSPVPYLARADLFLMLGCLLVYLLTASFLVTAPQRMPVVAALLALGIAHTAVGIAQAARGEDFMLFGFLRPVSGSRASGMLISPNHFAGFLEIAGVLGLSIAWWSGRKPAVRIFAAYAALCCYVGLLLSQSRGGVLCATLSLLVWAALTLRAGYLKNPHRFDRTLFVGVGALTLLLCFGGWFAWEHLEARERLATTFGRDIRLLNWQAALAQFRSAPVFGTGAGTHLYLGRLYREPELQSDPVHAHNDYLELLAEYGLIGAIGIVVVLGLHAWRGLRALGHLARSLRATFEAGNDELALVIGALAAFAGLAAHSFLDFNLHIPGNALVMAFLFGILAKPEAGSENAVIVPTKAGFRDPNRAALPMLGAILLALAIIGWPGEFFTERARLHLRDEEYPAAIASAARARRMDPWNPFTFFHLGEAQRLQAELEPEFADRQARRLQAERAFQEGLRLFPQDENLLVRRAQVLDRLKRFDEAEASFQQALAADPRLEILQKLYQKHRALVEPAEAASPR